MESIEAIKTIEREKEALQKSNTKIFCSNCKIIFYDGETSKYLASLFYEFKMLAFRHAWDTKHRIKIETSYISEHKKEFYKGLQTFSKYNLLPQGVDLGRFNQNLQLDYTSFVEGLRQQMNDNHDKRLNQTFEENWDLGSTCFCSTCQKEYHSPKEVCYCCSGSKIWMPWNEVNSLKV